MVVNDSELRNEMCCAIKFCYHLSKTAQETVKLMKEAYKDKCFGESMIFRYYGDFKKECFSAELVLKHSQPKNVVHDQKC